MATKRYHIIKAVFQVSGCTVLKYYLSKPLQFSLGRGRSAQWIMCAFSIDLCIRYTIIYIGIQFISFCFHLICLRHYLILYTCPNHQDILEIKFKIITHYVHAKYVLYVHRVHTFRELRFGYSLLTYLAILCIQNNFDGYFLRWSHGMCKICA